MAAKKETGQKMSAAKNKPKTVSRTSQKSGATNKAAQAKRETTKLQYSSKSAFGESIMDEVVLLLIIAACVVVLFSLSTSKMGLIGNGISTLFKGLFGVGGFILPLIVICFCLWILLEKDKEFMAVKIIGGVLFLLSFCIFFHVLKGEAASSGSFFGNISYYYKNGTASNGGVFGGIIGGGFVKAFNRPVTYLISVVLLLAALILVTGKSFFMGLGMFLRFIGAAPERKREKIKYKADRIRAVETERETRRVVKREHMIEKKKRKKGYFDIRIKEEEGYHDTDDDMPIVEALDFSKKVKKPVQSKNEAIYDFNKDLEGTVSHFPSEMDEIKGDVEDVLYELEKTAEASSEPRMIVGGADVNDYAFTSEIDNQENKKEGTPEDFARKAVKALLAEGTRENKQNFRFEETFQKQGTKYDNDEAFEIMQEAEPDFEIEADYDSDDFVTNQTEQEVAKKDEPVPQSMQASKSKFVPRQSSDFKSASSDFISKTQKQEPTAQITIKQEEDIIEEYIFPPIDLLGKNMIAPNSGSKAEMLSNAKKLEDTLKSFGVDAKVIQINKGPTVTRYELSPSQGVKVSKIVNLADDIALNLAANGIRIEAPIPGKAAVGIEVPNKETQSVYLRDVIDSEAFQKFPSKLAFALGQDISGSAVVTDIAKMPHLLIAGATGSGKSVCINTLITSILYKADPNEVRLLLIDPKVVELSVYNGIPHLLIPVVTDPKKAAGALNWAVKEMLSRYQSFAEHNVRDIKGYNSMKKEKGETDFMSQIVIVIDELADLMMAAPGEVEDSICRLAQMARAAGLHLIIATQRPSVDVITGLIKANIPSRLAFAVSSGTDSRTILDSVGAEKLLGKGDMLFYPVGKSKPVRIQGAFVTDKEVENIVAFVRTDKSCKYDKEMIDKITASSKNTDSSEDSDEFFDQAIELVVKKEKASVSMLQRQFRIGYNRAARLMEDLENRGIVGPEDGSKPRRVLMSLQEMEDYQNGDNEDY